MQFSFQFREEIDQLFSKYPRISIFAQRITRIFKQLINNDYFAARLVSDLFKPNLIMYANFQSQLKSSTKTAIILVSTIKE